MAALLSNCKIVSDKETDGKRTKWIPSELTSTNANSKKELLNPFSNTAKSGPSPLLIG